MNKTKLKTTNVTFFEDRKPALQSGDYIVTITEEVRVINDLITGSVLSEVDVKEFAVTGERFQLDSLDIFSVFPPPDSLGDHSNVLPHLILTRSTLPWERDIAEVGGDREHPWLALLLFNESEKLGGVVIKSDFLDAFSEHDGEGLWTHLNAENVQWLKTKTSVPDEANIASTASRGQTILDGEYVELSLKVEQYLDSCRTPKVFTLSDLEAPQQDDYYVKWPGITPESWQEAKKDTINVTVIDVEKQLLEKVLPAQADLKYLAHVRQGKNEANEHPVVVSEMAVLLGNRLPKSGAASTVHLVSLENRYKDEVFDFQGAEPDDLIRLVSLKSWSFTCLSHEHSFHDLLTGLNDYPLDHPPEAPPTQKQGANKSYSLRIPDPLTHNTETDNYLSQGYVPLPHCMRRGQKTISWYHGPLATGENPMDLNPSVQAADELLIYNQTNGMFDVSYAAAWELGRLLALNDKKFSVNLYNWKRSHAQNLRMTEDRLIHDPIHLSVHQSIEEGDLPEDLKTWFRNLSLFKGVPFNYLVPDERMLPPESIRFFQVNSLWVECLLDGAFSPGRVNSDDYARDALLDIPAEAELPPHVTGILLRSEVVAGWPHLLVDGYRIAPPTGDTDQNYELDDELPDPAINKLDLLDSRRLSENILLCLFDGEVKTVDIHQKPEALHCGFSFTKKVDNTVRYYKYLRDASGDEDKDNPPIDIEWKDAEARVIDINAFSTTMRDQLEREIDNYSAAAFAMQMMEGVQRVRFILQDQDIT